MAAAPYRILVLCTGNSCRSIMAEALLNHLGQGCIQAVSAGSHPTGGVHPQALATLLQHGISAAGARSKSWDEFAGESFDLVITVCDQAAAESCPAFMGPATRPSRKLHWSTPDPAKAEGAPAEIAAEFNAVYESLATRCAALLKALPEQ